MSSDAPVAEPIPLEAMQAAVTRRTRLGVQLGGDEQKITAAVALRAHTLNGAHALGRDHEIGSIEVGKLADFTVLDGDPLQVTPEAIAAIRVTQTWVNGVQVFTAT